MNENYVINGVKYVEVDRKAEVGEKVLVVNAKKVGRDQCAFDNGHVTSVIATSNENYVTVKPCAKIYDSEYRVLEECCVEATANNPQSMLDLIANLARRVTSLEQQLRDTQRNVETWAERTESIIHTLQSPAPWATQEDLAEVMSLARSNESDIRTLDERTQQSTNADRSGAKLLADAFEALARYEAVIRR